MRAVAWIATPLEEPPAPKFAYLASSWRSCAPSWHQDATTSPKISKKTPSWSQHLPTELPKPSQDSLQDPPEEAPTPKKPPKVIECCSFLHFGYFSKDRPQDADKLPRWDPKWCQVGHLSPKLVHIGANLARTLPILALSLPILAPRWDPRPLEMEPQTRRDSHPAPSWRHGDRQGVPSHP